MKEQMARTAQFLQEEEELRKSICNDIKRALEEQADSLSLKGKLSAVPPREIIQLIKELEGSTVTRVNLANNALSPTHGVQLAQYLNYY